MLTTRFVASLTFAAPLALLFVHTPARADVEMGLAAGGTTYASTWRGDYGGGSTLRASARFAHVVAGDFQVWESYASINHRVDTGLSVGVTGYLPLRSFHPYGRLFAIHQHEEGLVSVTNAPAGTTFGVGAGIRHRAGGGLSLGVEIPLRHRDEARLTWIVLAEATGTYFPDSTLGPLAYVGLDVGVGFDFLLR